MILEGRLGGPLRRFGSEIVHRQSFDRPSTARRKPWRAPSVARLAAGSAEDGSATEEDGNFHAS